MTAPFNFGQLKFLKALTEALFHEAEMMISADQVVANVCDLFEKIGGTKHDEIRLSLTATEIVLGGPFFTENDVADRVERLTDRLRNSQTDLCKDMARLSGISYACHSGTWEGGGQSGRAHGDQTAKPAPT